MVVNCSGAKFRNNIEVEESLKSLARAVVIRTLVDSMIPLKPIKNKKIYKKYGKIKKEAMESLNSQDLKVWCELAGISFHDIIKFYEKKKGG